jgi:hypothetical protein
VASKAIQSSFGRRAFHAARQLTEASCAAGFSRAKNLLEPAPIIITYYYLLCLSQERGREIGQFQLKRPFL